MIPSIIHQIWLDAPIDDRAKPFMQTAKGMALNYNLWTNDNVWPVVGKTRFEFADYWKLDPTNAVALSDVLRIFLVKQFGGFYLDADIELFKHVSTYQNNSFVTTTSCPKIAISKINALTIMNDFFGAVKGHPLLDMIISEMETRKNLTDHWTRRIGYLMFGEVVVKNNGADILLLDYGQTRTFAKHHQFASWVSEYGQ